MTAPQREPRPVRPGKPLRLDNLGVARAKREAARELALERDEARRDRMRARLDELRAEGGLSRRRTSETLWRCPNAFCRAWNDAARLTCRMCGAERVIGDGEPSGG